MERLSDLAIILKNFPYQERDRIAVFLTENHGKVTGLAKGGVHSRRFGGSLDFLACSRIRYVNKPGAEMVRIEEASSHHEFAKLHLDFERLTGASFCAEFCLRLLETGSPSRELFVILSNLLFQLDSGMPLHLAINAFLCKAFTVMGYPPSLLRCVQCSRGSHEIIEGYAGQAAGGDGLFYWVSEAGGMVCWSCIAASKLGRSNRLDAETLLHFHRLVVTPFKELEWEMDSGLDARLYRLLSDFLHHHIPGLPPGGLKSWRLLNDALINVCSDGQPNQPPPPKSEQSLPEKDLSRA